MQRPICFFSKNYPVVDFLLLKGAKLNKYVLVNCIVNKRIIDLEYVTKNYDFTDALWQEAFDYIVRKNCHIAKEMCELIVFKLKPNVQNVENQLYKELVKIRDEREVLGSSIFIANYNKINKI